jgi:hypothetical protein
MIPVVHVPGSDQPVGPRGYHSHRVCEQIASMLALYLNPICEGETWGDVAGLVV